MARELNQLIDFGREQLRYLETSLKEVEKGNYSEVKRLASTIRTLVHETSQSHCLILQIENHKDNNYPHRMVFFDKGGIPDGFPTPDLFIGCQIPMIDLRIVERKGFYDDFRIQNFREKWWERMILSTQGPDKKVWSRKDIILQLANKEGGSHVDPEIPVDYLKAQESLKYHSGNQEIGLTYVIVYEAGVTLLQSFGYFIHNVTSANKE